MKIRVISSRDELDSLEVNEEMMHFSFRPSNKDILLLAQRCPDIKAVQIPGSYKKSISKSVLMFLEIRDITILEGDVWGHRTDINEHYEIKPWIPDRIEDLKNEGRSDEEILHRLGIETRLGKDLLKFLIVY